MKRRHSSTARCVNLLVLPIRFAQPIVLSTILAMSISAAMPASAEKTRNSFLSSFFPVEACIGKIDWYSVGLSDGKLGIEADYFEVYKQLCSRKSRSPDEQAYFKGHELGLQSYCKPENIYQLARTGVVAIGACKKSSAINEARQRGFNELL
mgnify:CR=1 FL=1